MYPQQQPQPVAGAYPAAPLGVAGAAGGGVQFQLNDVDSELLQRLRRYAIIEMICAFIVMFASWNPIILPHIMAVFAGIIGWVQMGRFENPYSLLTFKSCFCSCCGNEESQLRTIRPIQISTAVLCVISFICSVYYAASISGITGATLTILANVVAIFAEFAIFVVAIMTIWTFEEVIGLWNRLMDQQRAMPQLPVAVAVAIASGAQTGFYAGAQPQYVAQPTYPPQAGYGAQPAYGAQPGGYQPQPGYAEHGAYAGAPTPGYGAPPPAQYGHAAPPPPGYGAPPPAKSV